jgi:arsenate reductase (thioredoxin)
VLQAEPPKTVLFVCEHGAAKSVIAAAYFNRLARERGLPYRAVFRGSIPDPELSPATRAGLITDGFDVRGWAPSLVTRADVDQAARVIVFAAPVPGDMAEPKVSDWNDVPAVSDGYDAATRAIRARVERLVEQLAGKK